jgi:hypothetical protein
VSTTLSDDLAGDYTDGTTALLSVNGACTAAYGYLGIA